MNLFERLSVCFCVKILAIDFHGFIKTTLNRCYVGQHKRNDSDQTALGKV